MKQGISKRYSLFFLYNLILYNLKTKVSKASNKPKKNTDFRHSSPTNKVSDMQFVFLPHTAVKAQKRVPFTQKAQAIIYIIVGFDLQAKNQKFFKWICISVKQKRSLISEKPSQQRIRDLNPSFMRERHACQATTLIRHMQKNFVAGTRIELVTSGL